MLFIKHLFVDLVNKLFIAKMFLAKRTLIFVKVYANKFIQIKSKKVRYNHCNLSMYVMIIHALILNNFFYNNLGISREIISFTIDICITKNKKFSAFCMNCIEVFNTFFSVHKLLAPCLMEYLIWLFVWCLLLKCIWGLD